MIEIESVDDVVSLLRPLLEVASVRIVVRDDQVELPRTAEFDRLPERGRDLLAAALDSGGIVLVVPTGGDPPFRLKARAPTQR